MNRTLPSGLRATSATVNRFAGSKARNSGQKGKFWFAAAPVDQSRLPGIVCRISHDQLTSQGSRKGLTATKKVSACEISALTGSEIRSPGLGAGKWRMACMWSECEAMSWW